MTRVVYQFSGDYIPTCPTCGVRLDLGPVVDGDHVPVGEDEEGRIYTGTCPVHGDMLVQLVEDEDEELPDQEERDTIGSLLSRRG